MPKPSLLGLLSQYLIGANSLKGNCLFSKQNASLARAALAVQKKYTRPVNNVSLLLLQNNLIKN